MQSFRSNTAELYPHGQGDYFLLSNEQGRREGEKCRGRGSGGGDHNYNAVFRSNAAELYSSAKVIFIAVNNKEEKTEEDEKEEE